MTDVKEIAIQIANLAITEAAAKDKTGEEKEHEVCEFLANLTDLVPVVAFLPNDLVADALDLGLDNIQAYFTKHDIKVLVKKLYNRIKHIFKK